MKIYKVTWSDGWGCYSFHMSANNETEIIAKFKRSFDNYTDITILKIKEVSR